jgi:hypothetical protein
LKYGTLNSIDDVTHAHVRVNFNQIAMSMKNNRLQPFSGLSTISRPFRVFDMAVFASLGGDGFPSIPEH